MFTAIKLVEIIGKAAAKISPEIQTQYSMIPWKQMVRMRNRLIHGYFDINLSIVWKTVTENIPPIFEEISRILEQNKKRGWLSDQPPASRSAVWIGESGKPARPKKRRVWCIGRMGPARQTRVKISSPHLRSHLRYNVYNRVYRLASSGPPPFRADQTVAEPEKKCQEKNRGNSSAFPVENFNLETKYFSKCHYRTGPLIRRSRRTRTP